MTLAPGRCLGPYEIEAPLGAGGMGEIYRARDTRLGRTVAIKVLPADVSAHPGLRQRLEREARALAGLSHPHICTLHDVGHEEGVDFLVMEHLEGESLAARLERGRLPLDEVLRLGIEIADALDAAHLRGLVHRDLKPGNLMLTAAGAKLLDFGLARATAPTAASPPASSPTEATQDRPLTAEGTLLGTLPYMAPEQLEGTEADARSDVFALGAVLYEAATGGRAFQGKSQASLIAAILRGEPEPIARHTPIAPPAFERAVGRCLAKDPDERWQSVRDLLLELRWIAEEGPEADDRAPDGPRTRRRERLAWLAAALALAASAGLWLVRPDRTDRPRSPPARLELPLPPDTSSVWSSVVAPDGRHVALSAASAGRLQLWVRPLDADSSRPLPGTEGATDPFWSPDSRFIGFFADGKLKKIDAEGGAVQVLCDAPWAPLGGAWSEDGTILFSLFEDPEKGKGGVYRLSSMGGTPERLELVDESGRTVEGAWPSFLPDGRSFLFTCGRHRESGLEFLGICAGLLDSGASRVLLPDRSRALYAPPGYLLYGRGGALVAQPFDAATLRLEEDPRTLAERLAVAEAGYLLHFSVSDNGVLVHAEEGGLSRLVLRDRNGRIERQVGPARFYAQPQLGPGASRAVVEVEDPRTGSSDIWIVDLDRDVWTRFTLDPANERAPHWSPDGRRIAYSASAPDTPSSLHVKRLSGGEPEVVLASTRSLLAAVFDWSPDGRHLLYGALGPSTRGDVWLLPLEEEGEPEPFLRTRFDETDAVFSPDGRWVAYGSDESGRFEVYVQPFPGPGEKRAVSPDGGGAPRFRTDGKELFYLALDGRLMAVPIDWSNGLLPGTPTALFSVGAPIVRAWERGYDASPDGQRFLVNEPVPGPATDGLVVTLDWTEILDR